MGFRRRSAWWPIHALAGLLLATVARAGDPVVERQAGALLDTALGPARQEAPPPGQGLFRQVLASAAFVGGAVGPLDVHVRVADGLGKRREAEKILAEALRGLQPAASLLERHFGRDSGLVSGRRLTVVLADADLNAGQVSFSELVALLDLCEDGGWSGWKPDLALHGAAAVHAPLVHSWEVLLFNLHHPEAADRKAWLAHGIGYRLLNLVANRVLACGAFGPVPTWLQQSLADELDIEAYGEAWVAAAESNSWSMTQGGWRSVGWEGFLPEGHAPPPPRYEPPPPLDLKLQKHVSDGGWIARGDSGTRHWAKLAAELKSSAPPSLRRSAVARDYAPRDRAFGRLVLHLLLSPQARPEGAPELLAALDTRPPPVRGGIRAGDPLPELLARALGGLPDLAALQSETLGEQLQAAERGDLAELARSLGAGELLALRDHREQSAWLYRQSRYDASTRQKLFNLIVEAEQLQQLREWEVLGDALDRATHAALATGRAWPGQGAKREAALAAFREALARPRAGLALDG